MNPVERLSLPQPDFSNLTRLTHKVEGFSDIIVFAKSVSSLRAPRLLSKLVYADL